MEKILKKNLLIFLSVVFLFLLGGFSYLFNLEINDKKEWSAIQTVVDDNSRSDWKIIRFPMETSMILLGIKTENDKIPFVWITLNSSDGIKISPQNLNFKLACGEIAKINEKYKMQKNVELFLNKKCTTNP